MSYQPLLFIIDDEIAILKTLKEALEDEGFRIHTLNETTTTLDMIGQLVPDLILLDIFMPNSNGINLLERIKKEYPDQEVMMISGFGNIQIALEAIKKGARDFIEKPLNLDEILAKIDYLKTQSATHTQSAHGDPSTRSGEPFERLTAFSPELDEGSGRAGLSDPAHHTLPIIGQSYLFKELMHQVNQATKLNFPLLIYGQHGVGKSLIAHYVHSQRYASLDSFIEFNGASQKNLSALKTFFNASQKGTLYIKNIDACSPTLQKKLLSYLDRTTNTQLSIIASASTSLFKLVQENKFDGSLFFKLNIIPLEIPPLAKRRYDIPLLVNYYLEKENKRQNKSLVFSTTGIRFLRNHTWHGNVLDLKLFIEKIVTLTPEEQKVITSDDIQQHLTEREHQFIEEQTYTHYSSLQEATAEFEKNFLLYLLKKNHYDLNQLSDRLNLNIPQLRAKMLELSIIVK